VGAAGAGGQPDVLLLLFVPDADVVHRDETGVELVDNAHRFVSRLAADRFIGYLSAQRAAMTGQSGAHTKWSERVAVHGYDTKYAMRLGVQGVELLSTGRITLPVPEPDRAYLRSVRRGDVPFDEVVAATRRRRAAAHGLAGELNGPRRAKPHVDRRLATPSYLAHWSQS
jgi:hypothetical protein